MSDRPSDAPLEELLDYRFINKSLLRTALTHPSFGDGRRSKNRESNARLEFLGDAVLGLVVADMLFKRKPKLDKGALTDERKSRVNNKRLAEMARHLNPRLRLGGAERNDQGRGRAKRLAAALEAIVGAIYLDAGPAHATRVVRRLLEQYDAPPSRP